MGLMELKAVPWEIKEGVLIAVKVDGVVFQCDHGKVIRPHGGRTPNIVDFIKSMKLRTKFTLEDFYDIFPHSKTHPEGTEKELSYLCSTGVLLQHGNSTFELVKRL